MMQSVLPASTRQFYLPGDVLSFKLQSPSDGMGIVPGTIRLSGTLWVGTPNAQPATNAPARLANTDRVYWNSLIGMHGLLNQLSTSCQKHGSLEMISDYGRAVATLRATLDGQVQTTLTSSRALELCAPDNYSTSLIAFGQSAAVFQIPFCIKPEICLNGATARVPFERTGDIEITCILSQATSFLHGADVAGKTFQLSDVQLSYLVAKAPNNVKLEMPKIECLYRSLTSTTNSFQTKGTMVATRMLMTFIPTAQLADATFDSFRSVNAGIQRVTFTYGDSTSLVTTTFRDQSEIMANYLMASQASASFSSALATVVGLGSDPTSPVQGGYGVGIAFLGGVDMRSTQLGLLLEGISGALLPMTGYLVFQGMMSI